MVVISWKVINDVIFVLKKDWIIEFKILIYGYCRLE